MSSSALMDARKAWVKHLERCRQCKRRALLKGEERCQKGQELRTEMLRLNAEHLLALLRKMDGEVVKD